MLKWLAFAAVLTMAGSSAAAQISACDVLAGSFHQSGPQFLVSYPNEASGPLHEVAFVYDNAVAAIALIACGDEAHAAEIGDALLIAQANDRFWHDGRLRNAYLAGPVTEKPIKLPGWWETAQNKWVEDAYQVGSDTGNQAWAMLALLAIHRATGDARYRDGALRIATFIENTAATSSGFTGGVFGEEPAPQINSWKSTEHNTDLAAAFRQLAAATNDPHWLERAGEAETFVASMWNRKCACFAVGTTADGVTRNRQRALDAQLWPLLAIDAKRYARGLATARHRFSVKGGGYAYGDARDGVWTEGTAQMRLAHALLGETARAESLAAVLESNRAPDGRYYAAGVTQLPTGFRLETDPSLPRLYFHTPHLAATAWVALSDEGFNPFTGLRQIGSNR